MLARHAHKRKQRTRQQAGAAVVEFALILPLLLAVVLGIIDFGFWFNESLNVRQGVRESARQAVVQTFGGSSCLGTSMERAVCNTKVEIRPVTGTAYARVVVPPAGWKRGERLLVCGMVKTEALTGLTPLPSTGLVRSATSMSIEKDTPAPASATPGAHGDAAPSGADWSWCA